MSAAVTEGTVIRFDDLKGYGFVTPDGGGEDVFIHVNDLTFDKHQISSGARVSFAIEEGDRGRKAHGVRLLDGESASPEVRDALRRGPVPVRATGHDFRSELTEALLEQVPSLRADQLLDVRRVVLDLVSAHGGVD